MAIAVLFTPTGMSTQKYDTVMERLEAAGYGAHHGTTAGRLRHICFGDATSLQVLDVYDSPATFEQFGSVLVPILTELGIDVGRPQVSELYNSVP